MRSARRPADLSTGVGSAAVAVLQGLQAPTLAHPLRLEVAFLLLVRLHQAHIARPLHHLVHTVPQHHHRQAHTALRLLRQPPQLQVPTALQLHLHLPWELQPLTIHRHHFQVLQILHLSTLE